MDEQAKKILDEKIEALHTLGKNEAYNDVIQLITAYMVQAKNPELTELIQCVVGYCVNEMKKSDPELSALFDRLEEASARLAKDDYQPNPAGSGDNHSSVGVFIPPNWEKKSH